MLELDRSKASGANVIIRAGVRRTRSRFHRSEPPKEHAPRRSRHAIIEARAQNQFSKRGAKLAATRWRPPTWERTRDRQPIPKRARRRSPTTEREPTRERQTDPEAGAATATDTGTDTDKSDAGTRADAGTGADAGTATDTGAEPELHLGEHILVPDLAGCWTA